MHRKLKILVFNKFYLPGYRAGGPVRTLANMVEWLGDEFEFYLVSLDRDVGDTLTYPGVVTDQWMPVGKAQVMYLKPGAISVKKLVGIVKCLEPDAVYLNSYFDPTFTLRMLLARRFGRIADVPFILAPRGEFSKGALNIKRLKKLLYLRAARLLGLYSGLTWQVSTRHERRDLERCLAFVDPAAIVEAKDFPPLAAVSSPDSSGMDPAPRLPGAPLRVCFLSRVTPMKNLDFALRVLANVKADVVFTIYGPIEVTEYWAACEHLTTLLPVNVKVEYAGEVHPSEVAARLAQHDLFLLPTKGENYGHVIHEALGAGLPVMISDQTPWQHVISRGVGWVLPLKSALAFARQIDEYAAWPSVRVAEVKRLAQAYAREMASRPEVIDANRKLFRTAVAQVTS